MKKCCRSRYERKRLIASFFFCISGPKYCYKKIEIVVFSFGRLNSQLGGI